MPMNFTFNNTEFDLEDFSNEIVIININTGSYFTIRGSSVTVLRWFFAPVTMLQIEKLVQETFPNEVNEAFDFLDWLKQEGLVQPIDVFEENVRESLPKSESNNLIFGEWTYSRFDNMSDLIRLDPIHDVSDKGWPNKKPNIQ
jgi:hypothetical protein